MIKNYFFYEILPQQEELSSVSTDDQPLSVDAVFQEELKGVLISLSIPRKFRYNNYLVHKWTPDFPDQTNVLLPYQLPKCVISLILLSGS